LNVLYWLIGMTLNSGTSTAGTKPPLNYYD
jgi:hypothetical protein